MKARSIDPCGISQRQGMIVWPLIKTIYKSLPVLCVIRYCSMGVVTEMKMSALWLYHHHRRHWPNGNIPHELGQSWWRHQMETFYSLLALCEGNSPVIGEFPSQRQVTQSFNVSLIYAWTSGWENHRDTGDWRRHRAHYNVTVLDMGADVLVPCVVRSSVTTEWLCKIKWSVSCTEMYPKYFVPSQCWATIENTNIVSCFIK